MIKIEHLFNTQQTRSIYQSNSIQMDAEFLFKRLMGEMYTDVEFSLDESIDEMRGIFPGLKYACIETDGPQSHVIILLNYDDPIAIGRSRDDNNSNSGIKKIFNHPILKKLTQWTHQKNIEYQLENKEENGNLLNYDDALDIKELFGSNIIEIFPDIFSVKNIEWICSNAHLSNMPIYTIYNNIPLKITEIKKDNEKYTGESALGIIEIDPEKLFAIPSATTEVLDTLKKASGPEGLWMIRHVDNEFDRRISNMPKTRVVITSMMNGIPQKKRILWINDSEAANVFIQAHQGLQTGDTNHQDWENRVKQSIEGMSPNSLSLY